MKIGVAGSGAMGSGIAQVAAQGKHEVVVFDIAPQALEKAKEKLERVMDRLVEKGKMTSDQTAALLGRISWLSDLEAFADCGMVIEAIVERLDVKQQLFGELQRIVGKECILATNTSSLSIAAIASALDKPERAIGIHFFNPAPLMPLVEIIPAVQTAPEVTDATCRLIHSWGKVTVLAKDAPGFIVNRVARPFYGEALRIYEEGFANFATIDWAMKEIGGFRMGPFELMDLIGNDVNYAVTENVFAAFYYDPRYRPSVIQKRYTEAGWLGRKTGRGYYEYGKRAAMPEPNKNRELGKSIVWRILVMLINEAVDALYLNIATRDDLDLAMTKGVNYPKGLLAWADEKGIEHTLRTLERLQMEYGEDRYRPSPLLRKMVRENLKFYDA